MLFADFEPFTRIGGYTDTRMPACAAYNVVVPDKLLTTYNPCTAIAPARNKLCTMTAKSTPYLSCHRDRWPDGFAR